MKVASLILALSLTGCAFQFDPFKSRNDSQQIQQIVTALNQLSKNQDVLAEAFNKSKKDVQKK